MNIIYTRQPLVFSSEKPSIFLAGPSYRIPALQTWRTVALKILDHYQFNGTVFVPEHQNTQIPFFVDTTKESYLSQCEWEFAALNAATKILFWIPRDLVVLPGFTTNVEFGYYLARYPDRIAYGRPDNSSKNDYLDWLYTKVSGRQPHSSLENLIRSLGEQE